MADGNPFASMLNPNAARTGLWDMRMMSAANRMETPFERGARGMYRGQGVAGDPMLAGLAALANEPDYSRFTTDPTAHAAATAALAPYGLAPLEANQVKQNTLLPNTGFFGNHPRLASALEGAVYGAAASHGGETPGQSIQGALEGMIGGQRIQQGRRLQQYARPFEAAGMMEQLQDMHQKRDLQEAEIQHYRVLNQKLGRPDHDMRAMGNAGPQDKFIPTYDNTTGVFKNIPNPNYDASLVAATHRQAGAGTDFDRLVEMRNQERKAAGKPPLNSDEIIALRGRYMASPVAPGEGARQPYRNLQDAQREHEKIIDGLRAKMLKADDPRHQDQIREQYYNDWTSAAMQAAASGQKAPPFHPPTQKDIQDRINQNNAEIQAQIDAENQNFARQYPQALETPGRKTSSPQTGSVSKKIPTYNPITKRLE